MAEDRLLPARSLTLLGSTVRRLRHDRGLTQDELAERAGVSRLWLSRVENGQRPGLEYRLLLQVLDALDATVVVRDESGAQPGAQP